MANKKFSQFDLKTNSADVQFVVGYNGTDNVRIAPANIGGNPAGSDTQLQYNNGGAFGAIPGFTYNDTTDRLIIDTTRVVFGDASGTSFQNGLTIWDDVEFRGNKFELSDGSAANPILTFFNTGDNNTGMFRPGSDIIAFATGGQEEFRIGANGEIGLSGANFGTSGQVLTSNGTGSGASWTTISGGGASDLNGLSDCLVSTQYQSQYIGNVPANATTAERNTTLGFDAGNSITNGNDNVYLGYYAGFNSTWGENNVALGVRAAEANVMRWGFVAVGYQAAQNNTTNMTYGVFIGREAGKGSSNNAGAVCVGMQSGLISAGQYAVAVGQNAGRNNTVEGSVSVGYQAGYNNTSGTNNTHIGYNSGFSNTTSGYRTMVGYSAGKSHTGMFCTGIGMQALNAGTGMLNVAVGSNSMKNNSGSRSVAVGHQSMLGCTAADDCVAIGVDALTNSNAGDYNIAIGTNSLQQCTSNNNTAVGYDSAKAITSSAENVSIGYQAHYSMTTGGRNIAIGHQAGYSEQQQEDNIYIGHKAGFGQVGTNNSDHNVVIGNNAKINNSANFSQNVVIGSEACELGTGIINYNVTIGYRANENSGSGHNYDSVAIGQGAGQNTAAEGNVIIGYNAQEPSLTGGFNTIIGKQAKVGNTGSTGTNNLVLGYQAQSSASNATNEITLGNSSITSLRCAVTSITSLSDERDKSEIKDLEYGLAFIDALQPREFVWDNRPETKLVKDIENGTETEVEFYSSNKGKKDFGFIAQEVRELDNDTLRLVYSENEDKLELSYGKLVPILVKAIQELKEEVELLKS